MEAGHESTPTARYKLADSKRAAQAAENHAIAEFPACMQAWVRGFANWPGGLVQAESALRDPAYRDKHGISWGRAAWALAAFEVILLARLEGPLSRSRMAAARKVIERAMKPTAPPAP